MDRKSAGDPRFYARDANFGVPQAEAYRADDRVFFDGSDGQRV